jgi:L-asparaginase/Glu-tRNA(Gln) amidotransferase subunit D
MYEWEWLTTFNLFTNTDLPLVKRRKAKHVWTTNGKISLKDNTGEIHNISTKDAFLTTARQTDPSFVKPENFKSIFCEYMNENDWQHLAYLPILICRK